MKSTSLYRFLISILLVKLLELENGCFCIEKAPRLSKVGQYYTHLYPLKTELLEIGPLIGLGVILQPRLFHFQIPLSPLRVFSPYLGLWVSDPNLIGESCGKCPCIILPLSAFLEYSNIPDVRGLDYYCIPNHGLGAFV